MYCMQREEVLSIVRPAECPRRLLPSQPLPTTSPKNKKIPPPPTTSTPICCLSPTPSPTIKMEQPKIHAQPTNNPSTVPYIVPTRENQTTRISPINHERNFHASP